MFKKKCPHKDCDKEIEGHTEKEVEWNLQTHIKAKHSEEE